MKGSRARNTGFTLIEVLVTVIIMAIGLLGLASLQLAAMKSNYSAYQRTQAVTAAYDLVDRFRIAPQRELNAHYSVSSGDSAPFSSSAVFNAWAQDLLNGPLALTPPIGAPAPPIGELDCSDDATTNTCNAGNCRITIRWDDSRPEPEYAGDGDTGAANRRIAITDRDAESLELTICTRLPEDI